MSDQKTYQPKGGMCASCAHLLRNCTHLKFDGMPVIGINPTTGARIVICTEHERKSKP